MGATSGGHSAAAGGPVAGTPDASKSWADTAPARLVKFFVCDSKRPLVLPVSTGAPAK
jgi:hypothetical protein